MSLHWLQSECMHVGQRSLFHGEFFLLLNKGLLHSLSLVCFSVMVCSFSLSSLSFPFCPSLPRSLSHTLSSLSVPHPRSSYCPCFKCQWWCCLFHESSMMYQQHNWHLCPGVQQKARFLLTWAATPPVWYGCWFLLWLPKGKVQSDGAHPCPGAVGSPLDLYGKE